MFAQCRLFVCTFFHFCGSCNLISWQNLLHIYLYICFTIEFPGALNQVWLVLLTAILDWKASCCQLSLLHHDISIFWWAVLAEQLALLFLLILYLLAKTVSVYIIQILYTYTVIYLKFDLQSYASCERLPMLLITFDLGTFVAYKYNNGHLQ